MVWIIVEGVDGAGKSTLVKRLSEMLTEFDGRPVEVRHHGPLQRDPFIEYELEYEDYRPFGERHLISDRWAWGELIYGPLYRGASRVTDVGRVHLDKFAESRGAVFVHVTNDLSEIQRRLLMRGEAFLCEEDVKYVWKRFHEIFETSFVKNKIITDHVLSDDEVEHIVSVAHTFAIGRRVTVLDAGLQTYVGTFAPSSLLLGETRNDVRFASAFVPYPATSGAFLLGALLPHPVELGSCGIANAAEVDVSRLVDGLSGHRKWVDRLRVVTLGKIADRIATRAGVEHVALPHPQFVRRFHHKRQAEYGDALAGAMRGEQVTFS